MANGLTTEIPSVTVPMKQGEYTLELRGDGFLTMEVKPGSYLELDVESVTRIIEVVEKITEGRPYPFMHYLIDVTAVFPFEAREYLSNDPTIKKVKLAEAIVLNSLGTTVLANVYSKLHKPAYPSRTFKNERKAKKWLSGFLK